MGCGLRPILGRSSRASVTVNRAAHRKLFFYKLTVCANLLIDLNGEERFEQSFFVPQVLHAGGRVEITQLTSTSHYVRCSSY